MCNFIKIQVQRLKVVTLILICAVCSINALNAQEFTIESPNGSSLRIQKTIIRNLSETHDIVYKTDGSTHLFCLVDSTTTIEARMPFTGVEINDFEILDSQYVFFCGNDGSGFGLIGYFDLVDVFSSTAPTVYYQYTTMTFNFNYTITNLKRLEVYSDPGNYVHVVMVGDCYCEIGDHKNYCVVDMHTKVIVPYQSWDIELMAYQKNLERFDDIAVGKTYVATSGVLAGFGDINSIRFYDKPVSNSTNLFSTMLYQTTYYSNYKPLQPVAIEHCEQDYFVTASVFDDGGNAKTILTEYAGMALNSQYSIKSTPDKPVSLIKDMAYHPSSQNLYFLQDFHTSGSDKSLVFNLDPLSTVYLTADHVIPSNIDVLNSLDANASYPNKAESSGVMSTGETRIYHRDVLSTTPCSSTGSYTLDNVRYPLNSYNVNYDTPNNPFVMYPYSVTVIPYSNTTECQ